MGNHFLPLSPCYLLESRLLQIWRQKAAVLLERYSRQAGSSRFAPLVLWRPPTPSNIIGNFSTIRSPAKCSGTSPQQTVVIHLLCSLQPPGSSLSVLPVLPVHWGDWCFLRLYSRLSLLNSLSTILSITMIPITASICQEWITSPAGNSALN